MFRRNSVLVCLAFGMAVFSGAQQAPQKKVPTVIRDTAVAEGKAEAEAVVKKEYSPALAAKSLDIGKQYFKRRNYNAAIMRFQEAIEYHPELVEAYDALGRAYEKKGDLSKAIEVYRDCVGKNPDSSKVKEFNSRISSMEKELGKRK